MNGRAKLIQPWAATVREQKRNRFFIEGDPGALLIVEFCATEEGEIKTSAIKMEEEMRAEGLGYAFPLIWGKDVKRVWDLRKAGLGILSNIPGDASHFSYEDCAVDVPAWRFCCEIESMLTSLRQGVSLSCTYGYRRVNLSLLINEG
jgi:hypothetical protein